MARPKKPRDARKTRVVIFHLTQAQFEELERPAKDAGLRVNEFVRIIALSKARRIVIHVTAASDPALIKRLDRIGHNLNQIVKNAHIFKRVSPKVGELCERIEEIIIKATDEGGAE